MWSEFVIPENVGGRIWPRTAAIAERFWSPQNVTDIDSMYARLAIVSQKLNWLGQSYDTKRVEMMDRLAGGHASPELKVLASVVEPPKGYAREELGIKYYSYTPLNHLIDTVSPESDRARDFRNVAHRIASGNATPADLHTAREWLTKWRDNDAALQPQLPSSQLTAELAPLSRNLAQAAIIGLAALDSLENRQPIAKGKQQQLATLKQLEAPQAALLIRIVPGVEDLVSATR